MKKLVYIIAAILFISCKNGEHDVQQKTKPNKTVAFTNIKDSLLYQNDEREIFLKHEVAIVSRTPRNNEERYFCDAKYKDSIVKLKDFVDVESFKRETKRDSFHYYFADKTYRYVFVNFPTTSPKILILDK